MNFKKTTLLFAVFATVTTTPIRLWPRVAQTTIDAVTPWEAACTKAGGGQKCNEIAVPAAAQLLAAGDACAQQDAGDQMIDLAKTLNNDPEMVRLTQIFVQQPRNSPTGFPVEYCTKAPKNSELNGLFQCQFESIANKTQFQRGNSAPLKLGDTGTIPFGLNAPLNPAGSCPANPSGPIPDGEQLNVLIKSGIAIGKPSGDSSPTTSSSVSVSTSSTETSTAASSTETAASDSSDNNGDTNFPSSDSAGGSDNTSSDDPDSCSGDTTATQTAEASSTSDAATPTATPVATAASDFKLQNGKDAQALNIKFASLTTSSSCFEGDQVCIEDGFAQCVGGKFVISGCATGTKCFALPLVNKAGTSIACTTEEDATARFAASGVKNGPSGSG